MEITDAPEYRAVLALMVALAQARAGSDEAEEFDNLAWLAEGWEECREPQNDFFS